MLDFLMFKWTRTSLVHQVFAAVGCYLSVMISATTYYWLSPYRGYLTTASSGGDEVQSSDKLYMTTSEFAWLTAIIESGAVIGCIPTAYIADRWGRKSLILLTGPIHILMWILTAFINNIIVWYLIRILHGLLLAIIDSICAVYVAEISSPKRRGKLVGYFTVFWNLGILYVYTLGNYLNIFNYLLTLISLPLLFCVTYALMPESPYYYFMVNKTEKAKQSLAWLRYGEDIADECKEIENAVKQDMQNTASWKELFTSKSNRRALLIVQFVCITRYMIGIITLTAYAEEALAKIGKTNLFTPNELSIFIGIIFAVTSFISSFFSDTVGRRKMLLFSLIGSFITTLISSIFYYILENTTINIDNYVWILYISLFSFCAFSNTGIVQLMPTIKSEYFPTNVRSKGSALTSLTAAACIFIHLRLYVTINETIGIYMNFLLFAFFALIAIFLVIYYLTESAGKTFAEINQEIKDITAGSRKN